MLLKLFKNHNYFVRVLLLLIIIIILTSSLFLQASAEQKVFDSEEFIENVTLSAYNYKAIDFNFQEGKSLEVVIKVKVIQELPIDIWFVNKDNYLLLTNGAQFLYFIDGTDQQVSYAKKVITLKEHDNYKLVLTNKYT